MRSSLAGDDTQGVKERTNSSRTDSKLGFIIDAYQGRLPVLEIGDAGQGELCYRVFRKGDISSDWRDESEVISVHLTVGGKKEAERIRKLIR